MTTTATIAAKHPAVTAMSVVRMFAGGISWVSPPLSYKVFGLGALPSGGSAGLVARLFGVRDLVLGAAVNHPDPTVRKAVLQAGVICDSFDVVASLLAVRAGAPKAVLVTATAGAAAFVAIGAAALSQSR